MPKCSFCGNAFETGTGKLLIKNDGRLQYFCSSKCVKNTKLGRKGRNVRWTSISHNEKKQRQEHEASSKKEAKA